MPEVRTYKENFFLNSFYENLFKAEVPKKSIQGAFSSVSYVKVMLKTLFGHNFSQVSFY